MIVWDSREDGDRAPGRQEPSYLLKALSRLAEAFRLRVRRPLWTTPEDTEGSSPARKNDR